MTHAKRRGNTCCSFISFCAPRCQLNSKGRITRKRRRFREVLDGTDERNWSLQGQRGKGAARFATSRFVDFFSAGPRYFLRLYLNLHVLVRAGRTTFMRKVSVTRPTIIRQFSWPLPALYSRARAHLLFLLDSIVSIIFRESAPWHSTEMPITI